MALVLWITVFIKHSMDLLTYVDDAFGYNCANNITWYEPYKILMPTKQAALLSLWDKLAGRHSLIFSPNGTPPRLASSSVHPSMTVTHAISYLKHPLITHYISATTCKQQVALQAKTHGGACPLSGRFQASPSYGRPRSLLPSCPTELLLGPHLPQHASPSATTCKWQAVLGLTSWQCKSSLGSFWSLFMLTDGPHSLSHSHSTGLLLSSHLPPRISPCKRQAALGLTSQQYTPSLGLRPSSSAAPDGSVPLSCETVPLLTLYKHLLHASGQIG